MDNEKYIDIIGYEGIYKISNFGHVISLQRFIKWGNSKFKSKERFLKASIDSRGYPQIRLSKNGKTIGFRLSRLVAKHFIENRYGYKEINHIDGNKKNSKYNNLEWCSRSENMKHAYRTGLKKTKSKMVRQTRNGKIINIFESIVFASKKTTIKACNISRSASSLYYKAGGFDWRYI